MIHLRELARWDTVSGRNTRNDELATEKNALYASPAFVQGRAGIHQSSSNQELLDSDAQTHHP